MIDCLWGLFAMGRTFFTNCFLIDEQCGNASVCVWGGGVGGGGGGVPRG